MVHLSSPIPFHISVKYNYTCFGDGTPVLSHNISYFCHVLEMVHLSSPITFHISVKYNYTCFGDGTPVLSHNISYFCQE